MNIGNIQWHIEKNSSVKEVMVELTAPLSSNITCHELYFMLIKYGHIRKYPRRMKKAFFYGTKNEKMRMRIKRQIYKYCII